MNRPYRTFYPVLAAITLLTVAATIYLSPGDRVITHASVLDTPELLEIETQTVEKEVGHYVHINARIKNTGEGETCYLIIAQISEDGVDAWEKAGLVDVQLSPGAESDTLLVGKVKCCEAMVGKYFDVKVLVYRCETESVLDAKEIDKAWHVTADTASGAVSDLWVD
jgi:hypothetical protein